MKTVMLVLLVILSLPAFSQKIFKESDLVAVVRKYHPVAKQAYLDVRIANANVTSSRGGFDPVAKFENGRKDFDGTTYYNQQWSELRIPTWYGIDLYAGKETVRGDRINPEETKGGLNYIGVSIPLVQNLVIDKRRAIVQQAKVFQEQSEMARRVVVNDLLLEALHAYWNWWEQHQVLLTVQASLVNAKNRLEMVKTLYNLGDRAAIDTLEATTQVQLFEQKEAEAIMYMQKSRLQLSTFLWREKDIAYELPEDAVPEQPREEQILPVDSLLSEARVHPLLLEYNYKLSALGIEKRLKFQSLLPQVEAKYNQLGRQFSKTFTNALFENNYRFGISMSMPLRLSEGRGDYRIAKLKIEQTKLSQIAKQVQVHNKVKQYYIEWQQTGIQVDVQQKLVANYLALQKGEENRFLNGESSLFLINARELRTIEGKQKLIELAAKKQRAIVTLRWSAGLFSNI
jgi:outer membrane protein TolC